MELKIQKECNDQKLKLKRPVTEREVVLDPERPVVLVHVDGNEEKEGESRYNNREIEVCKELVYIMKNHGIGAEKIGIITPYKAQKNRLAELRKSGVEVGTVDAFQGREKDIIIFSVAATNDPLKSHALSSVNKLNVAFTRARKKLIVVANAKKFWNLSRESLYGMYKPRPLRDEEGNKAETLFRMFLVYAGREKGLYDWGEGKWLSN